MLQALAHEGQLPEFDYLSTVSGGGYIGASLSYLLFQSQQDQRDGAPRFDVSNENFPLLSYPMVDAVPPKDDPWALYRGRLLRRLRQNAKYLTPGKGFTLVSLIGVFLRNSVASVLVHAAVLILLLEILLGVHLLPAHEPNPASSHSLPSILGGNDYLLTLSVISFGAFLLLSLIYVVCTGLFLRISATAKYRGRRLYDRWSSYLLIVALAASILGALPHVRDGLLQTTSIDWIALLKPEAAPSSRPAWVGLLVAILGALGNVWAFFQTRSEKKPRIPTSVLAFVASALLLFGVLLVLFHCTILLNGEAGHWLAKWPTFDHPALAIALLAIAVMFLLGWLPESNYVSLHRYYRDRLMEMFMPDLKSVAEDRAERTSISIPGNETKLGKLCGAGPGPDGRDPAPHPASPEQKLARGPYPILNANVVLVASQTAGYRGRGGDNFIMSPLFVGSRATGWNDTDYSRDRGLSLATAMAISGAAINPDTAGITRQPVLSVLMSMFNIRLGYWHRNPRTCRDARSGPAPDPPRWTWTWIVARLFGWRTRPNLISPGLVESFGRKSLSEEAPWVLLTDGGHFENLGLYELVRRRLKLIVVCDATHDPGYTFADLANAIEKVRADFGAIIDISSADLDALVPHGAGPDGADGAALPLAKRGYLTAPIRYSCPAHEGRKSGSELGPEDVETGTLIYITTTFYEALGADLHGYRQAHHEFPNQSTGDQFFDEKQFEAYRELGFQSTRHMLQGLQASAANEVERAWLVSVFTET